MYRNIRAMGNRARVFLIGQSAGGHLVSLLALDPSYLNKYAIPAGAIRGVVSMVSVRRPQHTEFVFEGDRQRASPLAYTASPNAPPFLITYCQWDFCSLPKQARSGAQERSFVDARLIYVPVRLT